MTEAANATFKRAALPFGMPMFGMPMGVPAEFREMTDMVFALAMGSYAKAKVTTRKRPSYSNHLYVVAKGATNYNLKAMETARTNTCAAFDYIHEMLGMKSVSELVESSTSHVRKQFDMVSAQNKELCALAQKVTTGAIEPIRQSVIKAFSKVTVS